MKYRSFGSFEPLKSLIATVSVKLRPLNILYLKICETSSQDLVNIDMYQESYLNAVTKIYFPFLAEASIYLRANWYRKVTLLITFRPWYLFTFDNHSHLEKQWYRFYIWLDCLSHYFQATIDKNDYSINLLSISFQFLRNKIQWIPTFITPHTWNQFYFKMIKIDEYYV